MVCWQAPEESGSVVAVKEILFFTVWQFPPCTKTAHFSSWYHSSHLCLSPACFRVSWTLTWQTWGKVALTSPASSSSTTLTRLSVVSSSSGWSSTTKTPKWPRVGSKYCSFTVWMSLLSFIYSNIYLHTILLPLFLRWHQKQKYRSL